MTHNRIQGNSKARSLTLRFLLALSSMIIAQTAAMAANSGTSTAINSTAASARQFLTEPSLATAKPGYFGAELDRDTVLRVRSYSPAGACGLIEKDKILQIDHVDVQKLSAGEILHLLQGRPEQISTLEIERHGELIVLNLVRTVCPSKEVPEGLNADQYWQLGTQMLDMGWPGSARLALQKVTTLAPGSALARKAEQTIETELPLTDPDPVALELNNKAWNLCHMGRTAEAEVVLEKCIEQYPAFEWPYQNLSTIYSSEGQVDEAEALIRKLLARNPKDVISWCNLASFQIQQGKTQAALKSYKTAHSLSPENERVTSLAHWLHDHNL